MRNPIPLLKKISRILKKNKLEELQIKQEGSVANFIASLSATDLQSLKKMAADPKNGIEIKLLNPDLEQYEQKNEEKEEGEYTNCTAALSAEENNQKYGVEICVKMN